MFTLSDCYRFIKTLPEFTFKGKNNTYYYKETPILDGYSLEWAWPRSREAKQLLEELGYDCENLNSTDKLRLWTIQAIYLKESPPIPVIFKNGNIRAAALQRFHYYQHKSLWYFETPIMQYLKSTIKTNWNRISQESKLELDPWFDETGNFSIATSTQILSLEGTTQYKNVRLSSYRLANDLVRNYLGTVHIPNTSSIVKIETIGNQTFHFSPEEWEWFLSAFAQCSNCKTWTRKENMMFGQCNSCIPFTRELQSYGARATDVFTEIAGKHSKYSNHLLGVELEFEQRFSNKLQEILYLLGENLGKHAIFKRDGSLTNGVEICTRPASIDIHLEEFNKFYSNQLLQDRLEIKSTCGMHVHIDRRKMTALTLGKLLNFIQQNDNKTFLEIIAERQSNTFSRLGNDLSVTAFHRGIATTSRYQGLNVCNPNTAEIRIFKTPTTFESFQKNMEFVSALTSFVQPANSGIKDTNYGAFLKYVKENLSTYKELGKFIKEKC